MIPKLFISWLTIAALAAIFSGCATVPRSQTTFAEARAKCERTVASVQSNAENLAKVRDRIRAECLWETANYLAPQGIETAEVPEHLRSDYTPVSDAFAHEAPMWGAIIGILIGLSGAL